MPDPIAPADPAQDLDAGGVVTRAYAAEVDDVNDGARKWVVARINSDKVDRFKTVVDPFGVDRSGYLQNPVVLWEHGKDPARGRVPIGRNAWIKPRREQRDLVAKTVFADDEFSRGLFELYRDGVLRGWSVNGTALEASPPTPQEIRRRPDLADCRLIYRRMALTEYSAVAIPGNPDALTEAVSRGAWLPDLVRDRLADLVASLGKPAPEPEAAPRPQLPPLVVRRTLDEVLASVQRRAGEMARAELKRAHRDALDLARGKV